MTRAGGASTFALWWPAVWHTMWLLTETTLDLLLALLLALLAAAVNRKSRKSNFSLHLFGLVGWIFLPSMLSCVSR